MSDPVDAELALSWRLIRYRRLLSIAAAVLAADQASKAWVAHRLVYNTYGEMEGAIPVIRGFFYIVHVGNTGAAWSTFSGRSVLLALLAVATLVAIFAGRKALMLKTPFVQICFGLLCGGIVGNLVDRVVRGHVLDFIDLHFGTYVYPSFNVADSAILVGISLYVIHSLVTPQPAP